MSDRAARLVDARVKAARRSTAEVGPRGIVHGRAVQPKDIRTRGYCQRHLLQEARCLLKAGKHMDQQVVEPAVVTSAAAIERGFDLFSIYLPALRSILQLIIAAPGAIGFYRPPCHR